ncbi:AAA family ATPase [Pseudomonas sp. GCM10022188]|uniref:AAA family ATPase n=1 Tax=Pseudomonas TaxID=286 RepID=UPI001E41C68C|nr:AAA family ATPase [Pseudomonas oryzagri]MCC6076366.1 AAA family ATPase [Pseudomonas oryzagri]
MTSLQADEAFVEHYQFNHDPFTPRVPGFKFFPAKRKSVLAQLHQLARYSALMQVVSGPPGSGKTLLRQALVASSNKQSVVCVAVSARQAGNSGMLLRSFSQGLGGSAQDVDGVLGQVARLNQVGQEVYLLVDDAEKLQDEALGALAALATGDADGRAHVFLFAEPELLSRLEAIGKADNCHVQQLQPYELADTRAYLAQRLEGAGQGLELLEEQQVQEIHAESGGWPGAINRAAREIMLEAMLAEHQPSVPEAGGMNLPKKHLLALGVVVAGVVLAVLMKGKEPEVAPGGSMPLSASGQPAGETEASASSAAPAIEFEGDGKPVPLPLTGQGQPVPREPLARAAGQAEVEELDASHAAVPLPAPTVSAGAPVAAEAEAPAPVPTPAPAVAPVVAAAETPLPVAAAVPAPAPVPAPKPTPAPVAPSASAAAAPAAPVPAPAASSGATGQASWYLSQPVGQYTLQLFGTNAEGAAQAMVREGGGEYRYFRKLHQGKSLFVVTYGRFSSAEAAKAAVAALPARLQAGKPWPRTFASIQQEIRQAAR